ncbi:MAG TPA: RsmE family RNA methyltransferase [Candidatus Sulfotelmatobacter sp.]|nr:RsmE family RNA methyltransferase [Candidatus Sulfotelmatobacter sp.]
MPSPADATPAYLYLPELPPVGEECALDSEDAHYVTRVCRAGAGQALSATDGRGTLARLTLLSVRGEVRARVEARGVAQDPGASGVACGAPEGQRADWMFEKLAELGVRIVQPLDGGRDRWERFASRIERWQRLSIAALRQSRQPWLLEIRSPLSVGDWLERLPAGTRRWLADPEGGPARGLGEGIPGWGAVGPSAGFAAGERESLREAGFRPVRLAPGRLRTETAAVAWAALWAAGSSPEPEISRESTTP